ncbi:MAG TPA: N-acetyltransferase [Erysipelotrichaceae bacterium]|nr:N-acetyltransferase [Erysipelotrichaceae bacterium]
MLELFVPTIETDRLILRPIRIEDAQDLFDYASDEEVVKMLSWPRHETLERSVKSINEHFLTRPQRGIPEAFAIVLKENGKMIGTVDVHTVRFGDVGEIGYVLNRTYHNHGYMSEALKAAIPIWFTMTGFRRLEIMHNIINIASRKVIEKAGFIKEGVYRQLRSEKDGQYYDFPFYALLKEDIERE